MQKFRLTTRGQNSTIDLCQKMLFTLQNVVKATPSADEKGRLGERLFLEGGVQALLKACFSLDNCV